MIAAPRILALAALGVAASLGVAPTPAAAQAKLIDEVKIGVLSHDVGFLGHHVETGADINLEVLFPSPDLLSVIWSPRPHIGADINTSGNTSDGYFGLTWGWPVFPSFFGGGFYFNGSLGGAVQDGLTGGKGSGQPPGRKLLGSEVLFRESLELGYQLTPMVSVSALLDHISNANLATHNAGITSAGARLGFRF